VKKYQELVKENIDEIEQLKAFRRKLAELRLQERTMLDRFEDSADRGLLHRAVDFLDAAEGIRQQRRILEETIAEYEDYFDTMLYQEYETAPAHTQRQGFAGFYRESGL